MKSLIFVFVFVVLANCYRYDACSALVPFYGSGNASIGIFCNNLQNYCRCMNYYYPGGGINTNNAFDITNTCVVTCKNANCGDWNIDCDLFYKNSANGIAMSHLLVFVLVAVLVV